MFLCMIIKWICINLRHDIKARIMMSPTGTAFVKHSRCSILSSNNHFHEKKGSKRIGDTNITIAANKIYVTVDIIIVLSKSFDTTV